MMTRKIALSFFVTSYVLVTCAMEQDIKKPETDSLTEAIAGGPVLQDPHLAADFFLDAPAQVVKSQKRKREPEKVQNHRLGTIAVLKRKLASQRRAKQIFLQQTTEQLDIITRLSSEENRLRGQVNRLEETIRTLESERNASTVYKMFNYFSGAKKDPKK